MRSGNRCVQLTNGVVMFVASRRLVAEPPAC